MSKKTRKIRHALFMSVISMMLCCAMLIGTTFAWFTEDASISGNILLAGSLDAGLYWSDTLLESSSSEWIDASSGAIFNYKLWEPGYTEVRYVKISNVGDLAFRYQLNIIPSEIMADGEVDLADVIEVYMVKPAVTVNRDDLSNATPVGTLSDLMQDPDGAAYGILLPENGSANVTLAQEDEAIAEKGDVIVAIALKMQETAGNEYQDLTVGDGFRVQLLASQYTWENDSFDNQYDVDSTVCSHTYENLVCTQCGIQQLAGLYDADGVALAYWNELINDYGLNVRANYNKENYSTTPTSLYYILNNYDEFAKATTLVLGDCVTSIGEYAFYNCSSIKTFIIADSVTFMDTGAFMNCTSIESIDLANVRYISMSCFENCTSLRDISLSNVTNGAWHYAFKNCTSLESIIFPESVNNPEMFFGVWVFEGCTSLKEVRLPNNIKKLNNGLFDGCTALESIVIPDSVEYIGDCYTFEGCSALKNIVIPEGVTSITWGAFDGCSTLESVTLPSSLIEIDESAFYGCSSLDSVIIPAGVTSIGYMAFAECYSLEAINFPDGLENIGSHAFNNCSKLKSVTLPNSLTSLASGAFRDCSSLTNITLSNNITVLNDLTFSGCSSLESIIIPDGVTSIGFAALGYCTVLESATIPSSVTSIGANAFYDSPNIKITFKGNIADWELISKTGYLGLQKIYINCVDGPVYIESL